jgi:hypothetical protein
MNRRTVLLNLISTLLLFALVVAASAQTRTPAVSAGNTFTYSYTVNWNSNDPNATVPSDLVGINETQWAKVSVTAVSGTNVTGTLTTHYKNGTETTNDGWVDVDTGDGNLTTLFISAGLVPGDSMYTGVQFNTYFINETVPRTYPGGARDTNHINVTSASSSSIIGNLSDTTNFYWDQSTGALVELSTAKSNQTGTYLTTWSEEMQITDSNVWTVPEFPTLTVTLITLIALTSVTVLIARQRQHRRPLR